MTKYFVHGAQDSTFSVLMPNDAVTNVYLHEGSLSVPGRYNETHSPDRIMIIHLGSKMFRHAPCTFSDYCLKTVWKFY